MKIRRHCKGADVDANGASKCKKCGKYPTVIIEFSPYPGEDGSYCENCAALTIADEPRVLAGAFIALLLRLQADGVFIDDDMLRS